MKQDKPVDYEAVLADLEAKRNELDTAISTIRRILGKPIEPRNRPDSSKKEEAPALLGHEYFGMGVGEAAKKYLEAIRRPQSVKEIADALEKGGVNTTAKNFYSNVYTALTRSPKNFVKVKKNWALRGWYPGRNLKTPSETKDKKQIDKPADGKDT
jgi:hypothetical protein